MSAPERRIVIPGGAWANTFLALVLLAYVALAARDLEAAGRAAAASASVLTRLVPAVAAIVVMMGLADRYLDPRLIARRVGRGSGLGGDLVAAAAGLASAGPVYPWYAFLANMRERGMRPGLAAIFLYNRVVKLELLPMMLAYFELRFVAVLFVSSVLASFVQGAVIDLVEQ